MQEKDLWMIVGFEVMPCSIKRTKGEPLEHIACKPWGDESNPPPQVWLPRLPRPSTLAATSTANVAAFYEPRRFRG